MNREIEFRGKRVNTGEWVYGFYFEDTAGLSVIQIPRTVITHTVIPETVGQYTGLKDKNGKEIFEGDIVFAIATYDCANIVVVWDDGGFVLVPCKYYKNYISRCGYKDIRFLDKEVIGNIHDNPELLEVV